MPKSKRNHYYIEMADEDVTANDVALHPIKHEPQCHNDIESDVCENSEKVRTYDCTSKEKFMKPSYEQSIQRHSCYIKPTPPSIENPSDFHLNEQRCPIKVEEADNFIISETDDVSESKSDVFLDSEMNVNHEAIKKPDENGVLSNERGENVHPSCSSIKTEPSIGIVETKKQSERSVNFQCSICGDTLSSRRHLKYHIARKHTRDLPFSCEQCPHKCVLYYELKRHVLAKHTKHVFRCGVCSFECALRQELTNHMLTQHNGMTYIMASSRPSLITEPSSRIVVAKEQSEKSANLQCSICSLTLSNSRRLKYHMARKHSGDLPFKCEQCPYNTISSYDLKRHVLAKHTKRLFRCGVCSFECALCQELKDHMLNQHNGMTYIMATSPPSIKIEPSSRIVDTKEESDKSVNLQCSICGDTLSSSRRLKHHIARKHSGDLPFKCEQCPHKTISSYELKRHVVAMHTERLFKCGVCSYKSATRHGLKNHMLNRLHGMTASERRYKCSECTYTNVRRARLLDHISSVHRGIRGDHRAGGERHQCPHCVSTSKTRANLKNHIQLMHAPKCFLCEDCGYACSHRDALKRHIHVVHQKNNICPFCGLIGFKGLIDRHIRTHTGERPYKCTQCDASFADSSNLKCHLSKHTTERLFACKQCNYKGKAHYQLYQHIRNRHKVSKLFTCEYCPVTAKTKPAIRSHTMSKHTGEHPFKCGDCDYTSVLKAALNNHIMSKHTKERPFKCSQCAYTTTTILQLKQHNLGQHSTERNFTCSQCDFKTYTVGFLNQHIKKKHG